MKSVSESERSCELITKGPDESSFSMMLFTLTSVTVTVPFLTMKSEPVSMDEGVSVPNVREAKCAELSPLCS